MATLDPHIIHKMENGIATTWCGETFAATGDWEIGDGGLCWKCLQRQTDHREHIILSDVVAAGNEWKLDPDSGPKRQALSTAIEQLDNWLYPDE